VTVFHTTPQRTIKKLSPIDTTDEFDCGEWALNRFLQRHALSSQRANSAQTYVVCDGVSVIGFYTLAVGAVEHAGAPARIKKGLARHPVPVLMLARLAIDHRKQGQGLGKALLKDALLRSAQAADIAGIRAVLIHAKDDAAKAWYGHFDFEPSPTDPYHMFLLMKDLRAMIKGF